MVVQIVSEEMMPLDITFGPCHRSWRDKAPRQTTNSIHYDSQITSHQGIRCRQDPSNEKKKRLISSCPIPCHISPLSDSQGRGQHGRPTRDETEQLWKRMNNSEGARKHANKKPPVCQVLYDSQSRAQGGLGLGLYTCTIPGAVCPEEASDKANS